MFRVSTALIFLLAGQGVVGASSILTLNENRNAATPSIMAVGSQTPSVIEVEPPTQDAGGDQINISPSITALGADAIPVTREAVAAIEPDEPPSWERETLPNVIRGGIEGGAFAAPADPSANQMPAAETAGDDLAPETAAEPMSAREPVDPPG